MAIIRHLFIMVVCVCTLHIGTMSNNEGDEITDKIMYLNNLLKNNKKVLKDVGIEDDVLYCGQPAANSEETKRHHDTCPLHKIEESTKCYKEADTTTEDLETISKIQIGDTKSMLSYGIPSATDEVGTDYKLEKTTVNYYYDDHKLDRQFIERENAELKEMCKHASVGLQAKCKDLEVMMKNLFRLDDLYQSLKRLAT